VTSQRPRSSGEPDNEPAGIGFDRIYRGEPGARGLNFERVPWDIGRPQVFEVSDATTFDGYDGRFDTVVSSQLVYCLNSQQRRAHVAALTFTAPDWSIVGSRAGHMEGSRPPERLLSQFALNDFRPEFTADGLMLMPVWALEAQRL